MYIVQFKNEERDYSFSKVWGVWFMTYERTLCVSSKITKTSFESYFSLDLNNTFGGIVKCFVINKFE